MPELAALCVPAKIIVVVEYQNSAVVTECPAVQMGRCKAGNPGADDDQIVVLAGVVRRDHAVEAAVARKVRDFERSRILPSQACAQRRIRLSRRTGPG